MHGNCVIDSEMTHSLNVNILVHPITFLCVCVCARVGSAGVYSVSLTMTMNIIINIPQVPMSKQKPSNLSYHSNKHVTTSLFPYSNSLKLK